MKPYLLVSGDFVRTGGMDMANFALARYLADRGHEVHLVAHRVAAELRGRSNLWVHGAPKPFRSYFLGEPLLDRLGRYWAARLESRGARVLVNGGNCRWKGSNWVHYVHAAYEPEMGGSATERVKRALVRRTFLANERRSLMSSRVIITNSARTSGEVSRCFPVPPERVRTVYYGIDAECFRPATSGEKEAARAALGWAPGRPVALFVGAVSDERKGFACLFEAWKVLCGDASWNVDLAVAGIDATLPSWKMRASQAGLESRIHFLGFRQDMAQVMAACDALVSPTRYEAYGLAVHEALCSGLAAFVTRSAGVAERYPTILKHLLIHNPDDVGELCGRLRDWRLRMERYRADVADFSRDLRAHTWDHACAQMVDLMEST
jgi:glycosyltransferase involved in cell wall biosynthesis